LERRIEFLSPWSLALALAHCKLGNVLEKRGDLSGAFNSYMLASRILEDNDADSLDLARVHCSLGHVLEKQEQWGKAAEQYGKACTIIGRKTTYVGSPLDAEKAKVYSHLGRTLLVQADIEQKRRSCRFYQSAMQILQKQASPGSLELGNAYYHAGHSLLEAVDCGIDSGLDERKAAMYIRRALVIYEEQRPGSIEQACIYRNAGLLLLQKQKWEQCQPFLVKSTEIVDKQGLRLKEISIFEELFQLCHDGLLAFSRREYHVARRHFDTAQTLQERLAMEKLDLVRDHYLVYRSLLEDAESKWDHRTRYQAHMYLDQTLNIAQARRGRFYGKVRLVGYEDDKSAATLVVLE
jgi:hypothetical protein